MAWARRPISVGIAGQFRRATEGTVRQLECGFLHSGNLVNAQWLVVVVPRCSPRAELSKYFRTRQDLWRVGHPADPGSVRVNLHFSFRHFEFVLQTSVPRCVGGAGEHSTRIPHAAVEPPLVERAPPLRQPVAIEASLHQRLPPHRASVGGIPIGTAASAP